MTVESKKITYLQKIYEKIRKYCMMNFIYKNADGSAMVYDKVLNFAGKMINEVKKQDVTIKGKRALYIKKVEDLSAQGFSYRYIKEINKKEKLAEAKQKAKKEYMDKIIYDAYYKRRDDDRDFGGELDIWGNSTKEFKFITELGVVNPYVGLQKMNQKEDVTLEVDDVIKLFEDVVVIFEQQIDKTKLKADIVNTFCAYGIDLL